MKFPGRISLSSGKELEKLLKFVSKKGCEPCSIVVITSCCLHDLGGSVFFSNQEMVLTCLGSS